jgi:MoaA/NifB/PqqE/SkfB family radical SAM enzyme
MKIKNERGAVGLHYPAENEKQRRCRHLSAFVNYFIETAMNKIEFLKYTVHKRRVLPIYLIFGITNVCNSRCLTCFNWKENNTAKDDLTLHEIEKIAASFTQPLLTLVFTGGEVFLRNDLLEIIRIFMKQVDPQFLAIPTNGIQYREIADAVARIVSMFKNNLAINISLDGIGELHDTIRGVPGNFEKVVKLYALLADQKKKSGNLSLGINTVLNSLNQEHYEEIFLYVRKNFPAIDQHNFEIMRGTFRDNTLKPPSLEFLEAHTPKIKKMLDSYEYHKSGMYRKFLHAAKKQYHSVVLDHLSGRRSLPCYAGSLAGVIDSRGNVFPCELLESIGNIKEYGYDFPSVWFSPKADEVRSMIKKTKCICTHSCFQFVNILFNPFEYPKLLGQVSHHST